MNNEMIINQAVNEAYYKLTTIAKVRANICGGYFEVIIPENQLSVLLEHSQEIINRLFQKFCKEISENIKKTNFYNIKISSFCFNVPSKNLLKLCSKIVKDTIFKEQSNDNLFELLEFTKKKYKKNEMEKSLNTIFDILLSYYCTIEN